MQVPLNDEREYRGGRLVYAHADGRVSVPTRTPGSATIHDCEIVHGVTEMVAGVRRALFFLQTPAREPKSEPETQPQPPAVTSQDELRSMLWPPRGRGEV